jgi:hypothetical protein
VPLPPRNQECRVARDKYQEIVTAKTKSFTSDQRVIPIVVVS